MPAVPERGDSFGVPGPGRNHAHVEFGRTSTIRLIGAVLAEQHDEAQWAEGQRYLGLDILNRARFTMINNNTESEVMTPAVLAA